MSGVASIEKPLLRAEEGASCDFKQTFTAKMHPHLFGGSAVLIMWTRGFASPNLFGFAFVGDKTGVVLHAGQLVDSHYFPAFQSILLQQVSCQMVTEKLFSSAVAGQVDNLMHYRRLHPEIKEC